MNRARHAAFRSKWLANRWAEKNPPIEVTDVPEPEPPPRARLTHEQFRMIRETTLMGMQLIATQDSVSSLRFKLLRDAWSELAQVQGTTRFVIEVEGE